MYHNKQTDGILSFQADKTGKELSAKELKVVEGVKIEETDKASLSRRGSIMALDKLSVRFGADIFDKVPNMWHAMTNGLLANVKPGHFPFQTNMYSRWTHVTPTDMISDSDSSLTKTGQNVIDSLSVLEAVAPTLHQGVWHRLAELFPVLSTALRSQFAIIRQLAARCFSTICDVMTSEAMRFVIENIIPLLGDPISLSNRAGATELMFREYPDSRS